MRYRQKGWKQGFYTPINKEKWTLQQVPYLSGWERTVFYYLDINPFITRIDANKFTINYICATDHKQHRYYLDVIMDYKKGDKTETIMVEIKPEDQIIPPKPPKKQTVKSNNNYKIKLLAYVKNQSKWIAADRYANARGWQFIIRTETSIYTFKNNQLQKIATLPLIPYQDQ